MAKDFFSLNQRKAIENAIAQAEENTSGEIRVHIDKYCKGDVLDRAAMVFASLKMHKTELRNGVLFYLAYIDRKFAVFGDVGINEKVPDNFWDSIKNTMQEYFAAGQFTEGLCKGIIMAGEQLKQHFPYQQNDINELSNDISFGN